MEREAELSDRELEILRLVATGASNKEIAQQLSISTNTVKVHLRNIFGKIGVASRTEATLYAIRSGYARPDPGKITAPFPGEKDAGRTHPGLGPTSSAAQVPSTPFTRQRQPVNFRWIAVAAVVVLALAWIVFRFPQNNPLSAALNPSPSPQPTVSRWTRQSDMPDARSGFAAVSYGDVIYVIGGETDQGIVSSVYAFQFSGNTWQAKASLPLPVSGVQGALIGEKIYIPGGKLQNGEATSRVEIYDPRKDTWEQGTSLPTSLSGYALAVLEGKLYLFGGWNGSEVVKSVLEYDPETDRWTTKTDLPSPRQNASAAAASGKIFVVGGENARDILSDNDTYIPFRDQNGDNPWTVAKPVPQPITRAGMVSIADTLILVGGQSTGNQANSVGWMYLPGQDTWVKLPPGQAEAGADPGVAPINNFVAVLGGVTPTGRSAVNQAYRAIYTLNLPLIP